MSEGSFSILYHSHAGSWFFTLLLFLVSFIFLKLKMDKLQKIMHMIFRLFSVIMIVTGAGMLVALHFPITFIVKAILAIALIGVMEMILVRGKKQRAIKPLWILFILLLLIVLALGFKLISL